MLWYICINYDLFIAVPKFYWYYVKYYFIINHYAFTQMMVVVGVVVISEVVVEAVAAEEADSTGLLSKDHQKKYEYILSNMLHYFIKSISY